MQETLANVLDVPVLRQTGVNVRARRFTFAQQDIVEEHAVATQRYCRVNDGAVSNDLNGRVYWRHGGMVQSSDVCRVLLFRVRKRSHVPRPLTSVRARHSEEVLVDLLNNAARNDGGGSTITVRPSQDVGLALMSTYPLARQPGTAKGTQIPVPTSSFGHPAQRTANTSG